jgi:uncharacterized protein (TIGR03067 family)
VDAPEILAGLIGYCRLRRLDRTLEAEDLQGKWVLEHWEAGGDDWPVDDQQREGIRFYGNSYSMYVVVDGNLREIRGMFMLDSIRPGRFMEIHPSGLAGLTCLYEIQGDTLRLVSAALGAPRPVDFKTEPGQQHLSYVFKRAKPIGAASP